MPQLDAVSWIVWFAAIALEAFVWSVMVRAKSLLDRPALFAYISSRLASDLLQLATYNNAWGAANTPRIYFYGYWAGAGVSALLQLWLITELGCRIAPLLARYLRLLIPLAAFAYLVGSVESTPGTTFVLRCTRDVVFMQRSVSLAWLALFVCLSYISADLLGIRWKKADIGIALGFTIQAINETGIGWLLGALPHKWLLLSNLQGAISLFPLAIWSRVLLYNRPPLEAPCDLGELLSATETLESLTKPTLRTKT